MAGGRAAGGAAGVAQRAGGGARADLCSRSRRSRSTRPPRATSTTRSASSPMATVYVRSSCTSRMSAQAGRRRPCGESTSRQARRAGAPAACTCPAGRADAAARALRPTPAACPGRGAPRRQHRGAHRRRRQGPARRTCAGADPQPRAPDLRRGARGAGGARAHPNGDLLARADALATRPARAASRARRIRRSPARELSFEIADGRVVDARWDQEPRAHALVEELMLLANEAVGGSSHAPGARRSTACTSIPSTRRCLQLADRLTALGLPVAPLPGACEERPAGLAGRGAPGGAARADPARAPRNARGLRQRCCSAYAPARALRPGQHRPRCARITGVRALHPRPSGAIPTSSCTVPPARSRSRGGRLRRPGICPSSRCAARSASARRPTPSGARMPSACVPAQGPPAARRLAPALRGRRDGPHRRRPVRALRRCLRGLPAGAAARRARALRQRRARRRAGRSQLGRGASGWATSSRASSPPSTRRGAGDARRPARERGPAPALATGQEDDAAPPPPRPHRRTRT